MKTKHFIVSIVSKHNAEKQLDLLLGEEKKCRYMSDYQISEITKEELSNLIK